jgi:hypothetical protein
MGAQLTFSVPNADAELVLRLVASYGGCPSPLDIKIVDGLTTVEFPGDNGATLQGLTTACTCVANACPSAAQLIGYTPETEAKVRQYPARLHHPSISLPNLIRPPAHLFFRFSSGSSLP